MDSFQPEICLEIKSSETDPMNETKHLPNHNRACKRTSNSVVNLDYQILHEFKDFPSFLNILIQFERGGSI